MTFNQLSELLWSQGIRPMINDKKEYGLYLNGKVWSDASKSWKDTLYSESLELTNWERYSDTVGIRSMWSILRICLSEDVLCTKLTLIGVRPVRHCGMGMYLLYGGTVFTLNWTPINYEVEHQPTTWNKCTEQMNYQQLLHVYLSLTGVAMPRWMS